MNEIRELELKRMAYRFRETVVEMLHRAQSGHPGGSLSTAEILTVLYYDQMNIRPSDPHWSERDRMILSKGHAAPMLYAILSELGYFPAEELSTFRQIDSRLQGHPCAMLTPGVDASAGPLGLGLSYAVGECLAARVKDESFFAYVLMGDGELQEGIVWEAAMSAAKFALDKLIVIVDNNGVQLDGDNDEIMPLGDLYAKFAAFGWRVFFCDGHDVRALSDTLSSARVSDSRPTAIIAQTVKGKGVSFMENMSQWHGKPISDADYGIAMRQLKEVNI